MSIWKHKQVNLSLPINDKLTLGEGFTAIDELNVGGRIVYIKREDLNPTGSWKDRASAYKISQLKDAKVLHAVISSSGNAAISLLTYANQLYPEITLHVIVSEANAAKSKIKIIQSLIGSKHKLYLERNLKKKRAEVISKYKAVNLGASLDNDLVKSYWSLGLELANHLKNRVTKNDVIYIPASSGTAAVGIVQGLTMKLAEHQVPRIVLCQTQSVNPIVQLLGESLQSYHSSLADSIIDRTCLRSPQLLQIIKNTNGSAYAITDVELEKARTELLTKYPDVSYTSLLSYAAMKRELGEKLLLGNVYCIFSGR